MTNLSDLKPGPFSPATIDGGLPKLLRIWEYLRGLDTGGYGSGRLVSMKNGPDKTTNNKTSCSPFTATVIYMALDPRSIDTSQPYSLPGPYDPRFDAGKVLTSRFYHLHNGFPAKEFQYNGAWMADFKKGYLDRIPGLIGDFALASHPAGSVALHNLGFIVDDKQVRRGDVVGIDWMSGHGHAVFCWNVHLDKNGDVDCIQFVSSNGGYEGDVGITVSQIGMDKRYLQKGGGGYQQTSGTEMFTKAIADPQAYPEYVTAPYLWYALRHIPKESIDTSTFGVPKDQVKILDYKSAYTYKNKKNESVTLQLGIDKVGVARLFGVVPPEPYLGGKAQSGSSAPAAAPQKPVPAASVKSQPVDAPKPAAAASAPAAGDAPAAQLPDSDPKSPKDGSPGVATTASGPAPVQAATQDHQLEVEVALQQLWIARFISVDPGKPDSVNDAQSQAAVKDFQTRYLAKAKVATPGYADPVTRKALNAYLAWAVGMPMVHLALATLHQRGHLEAAPGDNAGWLDDPTIAALKEFQGKRKLDPDGIPGPKTQAALLAALKQEIDDAPAPAAASAAGAGPAAPAASAQGKGGTPAVTDAYFSRNRGKAGDKVSVVVVVTSGEGLELKVELFQGGAAVGVTGAVAVTIKGGRGKVELEVPAGAAPGSQFEARVSGEGLTGKSAIPFEVETNKPASKGKIRSGGFTVQGKSFADWFNGDFRKAHPEKAPMLVKGNSLVGFPDKIDEANFRKFFDACKEATGRDELSIKQFCACFMIPYNETGGTFRSFAENGGHAVLPHKAKVWADKKNLLDFGGELGYFFWGIVGIKKSYNLRDGNWTWPAGDELKRRGLLTDPKDIDLWNGQPFWSKIPELGQDKLEPLNDPKGYPNPQQDPLKSAQKECHFYKFRGRGLSQTTGREGYTRYVNPALKDAGYPDIDKLTNDELDKAMLDPKVYVGVYRREVVEKHGGSKDFDQIDTDAGMIKKIGTRIGGAASYGEFYEWRCNTLAQEMEGHVEGS